MPIKTERGDSLGFSNIQSVAKQQKNEGGPLGKNNSKEKRRLKFVSEMLELKFFLHLFDNIIGKVIRFFIRMFLFV